MNYSAMDDKIFEFVYVLAMRDATLQQSFLGQKALMTDCRKFTDSTEELKAFWQMLYKENLQITIKKYYGYSLSLVRG